MQDTRPSLQHKFRNTDIDYKVGMPILAILIFGSSITANDRFRHEPAFMLSAENDRVWGVSISSAAQPTACGRRQRSACFTPTIE